MIIQPKNWIDFQHYKHRSPPWIKLHRALLDNFDFHRLPVASRALAPCLWLLASEHAEGHIDADPEKLAFRFRMDVAEVDGALKPLIDSGFFTCIHGASMPLAEREQDAKPEKSREEKSERPASRRQPGKPCPQEFDVTESMADWANALGLPDDRVMPESEKFLAHHRAKGSLFSDWNSAWQNWIRKSVEFGGFKPRMHQ